MHMYICICVYMHMCPDRYLFLSLSPSLPLAVLRLCLFLLLSPSCSVLTAYQSQGVMNYHGAPSLDQSKS